MGIEDRAYGGNLDDTISDEAFKMLKNLVTLNFGDDDEDEVEEEDDSISQAIESVPSDVVAFGQGDLYDEQKHLDALTYSSSVSGALGEEGSFDYIDDPNQEPSEAPAMLKQLLPFL